MSSKTTRAGFSFCAPHPGKSGVVSGQNILAAVLGTACLMLRSGLLADVFIFVVVGMSDG